MNTIFIAGHMGNDPEVRFTSGGSKVTSFRVATNSRRGSKDETTWWKVTVWGENFDKLMPYLKKGSPVMIHGDLSKPEIFQDRSGQPQVSLNVTAHQINFSPFGRQDRSGDGSNRLSAPQANQGQNSPSQDGYGDSSDMNYSYYDSSSQGQAQAQEVNINDDEIPF